MFPPNQYIPQVGINRRPLLMWLVVATASAALMALVVSAPLALKAGHPFLGLTIYHAFSYVCHQIPERCFFIAEHQFAVCARCTGLYAGFTMAALVYPLVRSLRQTNTPARRWLFIAAAPLAIDVALGYFGIWHNTHFSRLSTGALFGAVAVFYVMPGLVDLSLREWRRRRKDSAATSANKISPAEMLSTGVGAVHSDYSAPERRI